MGTAREPTGDLAAQRAEFEARGLVDEDLTPEPLALFDRWFAVAREAGVHEPEAMVLATATSEAVPSARFVLLRGHDERGFTFYTNRLSRKAADMDTNSWAALVFPWIQLSRQVRVEGVVMRAGDDEADAYFAGRPRGSQVGAWASAQSSVIAERGVLEDEVARIEARYEGVEVPRPPHWGGYRVRPRSVEFWQGRANRLHDRVRYDLVSSTTWRACRLAP